ncbi:MAG: aminotransferase class V-fold PLP-dependent enzyme, partial [Bacteroidales bacterium]
INPVKEITSFIHARGALVCVDGVAAAPHRLVDVKELGVDFYVFSFYKVFGPHYALLYGRRELLEKLPGINHFFIGPEEIPYKLQPGNVNYELTYSLPGIIDYFKVIASAHKEGAPAGWRKQIIRVFDRIASHESRLGEALLDFLNHRNGIRIIGEPSADPLIRVPTISFVSEKLRSDEITLRVDPHKIGIRYGDFYARRLIDNLGLSEKNGVVRVSIVHYNTLEEVERLIDVLDDVI